MGGVESGFVQPAENAALPPQRNPLRPTETQWFLARNRCVDVE